jgi:RimJ/RimL family protein N-acetyltransferase
MVEAHGLLLRPWSADDAADVLRLAQDPVTKDWSASLRPVDDLDAARDWIAKRQSGGRFDWVACDAGTGEVVARVGLHHFDAAVSCELGYGVWPAHRGNGIAVRAARAAAGFALSQLGMAKVTALHAVGNAASCAVASKAGFVLEGVEWSLFDHGDGVLHDVHRHSRTLHDPDASLPLPPQPIEPVELTAGRWRLVPWSEADLGEVTAALAEPHIVRWDPGLPWRDESAAARWLTTRRRGWVLRQMAGWGVHDPLTGELVGSVTLRDISGHEALVAYWVRAAALGRGIAPAAVSAATRYAFGTLGLQRVGLYHAVDNSASCRVAEKAGFSLEGTTRGSGELASGWTDEHLHARLASD